MATFSVDITSVLFAGGHSGYKDITIVNMPGSGVTGSIIGADANSFGFRIPGSQDVYRVYTTSTDSSSTKSAVFRLTNNSNSSDYVEVDLCQLRSGFIDTDGRIRGCVVDVICDYPSIVNKTKGTDGTLLTYNNVYADYNNGGDLTARCTVLLDGDWHIPSSSSDIPNWISLVSNTTYTDTGFKQVYVSFVNNYSDPRSGEVLFGSNSNNYGNFLYCNQDGYPSSTSGCNPVVLTFPKAGDTLSVTVKHPNVQNFSLFTDGNLYYAFGNYNISKTYTSSTETTVSIQIPQNASNDEKEGIVLYSYYTDTDHYLGHTVVKQLGSGPSQTLTVDPLSLTYTESGGGRVLNVTFDTTLTTNESSFPSWLSATYVSTGAGSRSYTITASENTSGSARSFDFVLSDANMSVTVPISQAAGSSESLTISPTQSQVSATSGSVSITVTSEGISTISYNISSSWIQYGSKSGNVYVFNYTTNASTSQRVGTIVFSGGGLSRTYTLTQEGASNFSISPSSGIWAKGGAPCGDGYVYFTDNINPVTAVVSDSWISATVQSNNNRALISCSSNTTGSERNGTVTFTDDTGSSQSFSVRQAGTDIVFVPSSVSFNADGTGGPDILYVCCNTSSYTQDAIHPVSNTVPSWLHFSSPTVSLTRASFSITADVNDITSPRSAIVKFSEMNGQYVGYLQVSQAAGEVQTLSISPTSSTVSSSAGSVNIIVTGTDIGYITYDWLIFTSKSGNVYTFSYPENTTLYSRTETIIFTSGDQRVRYTLTQLGRTGSAIIVDPEALAVPSGSNGVHIAVIYNGSFTVTNNLSWVSCPSGGTASGTYSFSLTFSENEGTMRSGNIIFTGDNNTSFNLQVFQSGSEEELYGKRPVLSTERIIFSNSGGSEIVAVNYDGIAGNFHYNDPAYWLSMEQISPAPGINLNLIVYKLTALNNTGSHRGFELIFTSGELYSERTSRLVITQEGGSPSPTGGEYRSLWKDHYYVPADWSGSTAVTRYYPYKLEDAGGGDTLYEGIAVVPSAYPISFGGINIPRIIENYLYSDIRFFGYPGEWYQMTSAYMTVNFYNNSSPLSPVLIDAFKYYYDWSGERKTYESTISLSDPINYKGCNNMLLPFSVFNNDTSSYSYVKYGTGGGTYTKQMGTPYKFSTYLVDDLNNVSKVDFYRNNSLLYSYDLSHCGSGYLIYRNRYGGWDSFLIEGNVEKTDNYTRLNYVNSENSTRAQKVTFSNNIKTVFEANTGWLTDEESDRLAFHLLSSPVVFYVDLESQRDYGYFDNIFDYVIPVSITNSSVKYKKFKNGRKLNSYVMTFEETITKQIKE